MSGAESVQGAALATAGPRNEASASPGNRARLWKWAGLLLPVPFFALLELAVSLGWLSAFLFPPPSDIAQTLWYLAHGPLWEHLGASIARVAAGFSIGAILAIVLGSLVGLSKRTEWLLEPTFQGLRAIPSLAWVPLLLLWLGIDETPKIVLIAIGAFFPVYLNLVSGIHNVDRKLIELGAVYKLSRLALIRRIVIPSALPELFSGLRTGLSLAWMFLVAAELIAASEGLGFLLTDGRETSRPDLVITAILLLAVLGKLTDTLITRAETRYLGWRDTLATQGGNTR